ncbi:MAG TPA: zf-HC2 domain-containing protein [Chthonomonadaceae bacterium]|nr:zf-HC2 domain-containing protein [Chthonomonadaceae bacterium]
MNCRKVSHLLSAYMDGELPGVEHRQIHLHLNACPECQAEYEGLLQVKRLLAGMRIQEPRPELPGLILQRLVSAEAQATSGGPASWLRQFCARWKQIAPPPPVIAFGTGLAAMGILWTVRMVDTPNEIHWQQPTSQISMLPLASGSEIPRFGLYPNGASPDLLSEQPLPVVNPIWTRNTPLNPLPVVFSSERVLPRRYLRSSNPVLSVLYPR